MKKVALSLMALALVGASAFAADSAAGTTIPAPLTASLSANGWAQVGVDLDTKSVGFKNGSEAKITLDILNGGVSKGEQGGVIAVADIKLRLDGSTGGDPTIAYDATKAVGSQYSINKNGGLALTIGDLTAKIVLGDLYIKLRTNTDPATDYSIDGDNDNGGASIVADDAFYTYSGTYGSGAEWTTGGIASYSAFAGTGVEVGYTIPKTLSITATTASAGAWSSTDKDGQPFEGSLAVGLLAVDKLTLNVKGYVGSVGSDMLKAIGAELAYDLGVVAPFAHVNAAADSSDLADNGGYALDAGAKLPIVDGLKAVAVVKYDSAANVDFTLTTDLAKAKLAGPLGALFGVQLKKLTSDDKASKTTAVFAKVEADVADGVNVWGKTSFDSTAVDKSDSLFFKAGVTASKVLPLTEFSLTWESNSFGAKASEAAKAANVDNATLGELYFQAKVSY